MVNANLKSFYARQTHFTFNNSYCIYFYSFVFIPIIIFAGQDRNLLQSTVWFVCKKLYVQNVKLLLFLSSKYKIVNLFYCFIVLLSYTQLVTVEFYLALSFSIYLISNLLLYSFKLYLFRVMLKLIALKV